MQLQRIEEENRKRILQIIEAVPKSTPVNWSRFDMGVGGIEYIGFSETYTEKLICISSQEQSVIDCKTRKTVFCEVNYDERDLIAFLDMFPDEVIHLAGIGGGGLRHFAPNGDNLTEVAPYYPQKQVIFAPSYKSCFLNPAECNSIFEDYELRAFGFSKCGNYMVAASASDLSIFIRKIVLI